MIDNHRKLGPFHTLIETKHVFNEDHQVFLRTTMEKESSLKPPTREWLPIQFTWVPVQ